MSARIIPFPVERIVRVEMISLDRWVDVDTWARLLKWVAEQETGKIYRHPPQKPKPR
jgi:hypothetical protein